MAIVTFILGHSGSGKSYAMRNLNPETTALYNVMGKPLPFRGKFKGLSTDNAQEISRTLPCAPVLPDTTNSARLIFTSCSLLPGKNAALAPAFSASCGLKCTG